MSQSLKVIPLFITILVVIHPTRFFENTKNYFYTINGNLNAANIWLFTDYQFILLFSWFQKVNIEDTGQFIYKNVGVVDLAILLQLCTLFLYTRFINTYQMITCTLHWRFRCLYMEIKTGCEIHTDTIQIDIILLWLYIYLMYFILWIRLYSVVSHYFSISCLSII